MRKVTPVDGAPTPTIRRRVPRHPRVALGVGIAIGLGVSLLLADAFVPARAHDVHSMGGAALNVRVFDNPSVRWTPSVNSPWTGATASESLVDMQCRLATEPATQCNGTTVSQYFPELKQSTDTLYVEWVGCISWSGSGPIIAWTGFNVEYRSTDRAIVIHCYAAGPWIWPHQSLNGVAALPLGSLIAVPTASLGPGPIRIVEDDRLEHLVGDQSTEFELAAASIS